ncbi:MAG: chitobiase/beta-hexosaminidase C-terminal domain-containing protein [Muribaculaceae bacterium]|nr:chitobiase/beta-hexosaminidase C-terminal domain-containing protein [Muribaculaceae bacterium]
MNLDFTGVTGTSYTSWYDKTGTSGAVYAGNSAAGNNSIQMRATKGSAIVTTESGGKVKSITVTWNENTADGRTLNIYCSNTAYTLGGFATDFNNNNLTPVGTIVNGTSSTLSIDNDYSYIAFTSASGALYLDKIEIVWEVPDAGEPVIRVDPTSLTINEDGGSFNVTGTNLNDDNVGVTAPDGFSRTTNDQDWGFINQGGSVSGTAYVNYTGRDLVASGTVTAANNQTSASVAVTYRPDIYLYGDLSDNNHDDWGDIADGQMERNGDVYSKTITLNEKGFLLFARKTGETYGWDDNRLFFGPAATDNWVYVSDVTNAALDLNPQTQYHPLELPAGIYTITINAVGNTFSISREELPTPIGETCPAVIEFENNYNQDGEPVDGTANFASMENFLKAVGAGSVFIQSANWSYLYPGSTGLKFSSSKNNGSLTINLKPLTSGSWRANKIIINAKSWINSNGATDEGAGFSINGTSFSTTNEFADYELTVDDATALESITIAATKRIYVKSITIMHECGDEPILEQVAIPTFTPAAGTYTEVQNVEINCATDGATIYYTTDGTEPTTTSSVYSTAITVGETMTIKAMAVKEDMENSAVATAEYIINLPTEVATIAAAQDLDNNTTFNFTGTAVVTFHNSNHLYIRDDSGSGLIYGVDAATKKYNNGDVLTAGWKAKNDVYQVHTPEFTNPTGVGSTANNGTVAPEMLPSIQLTDVNKYAGFNNVTIKSANGQNYYIEIDGVDYCLRRAYTDLVGELTVGKKYNVTGVVTIYRSGSSPNYTYTPQLNLISAELIKEDLTLSFDPASVELYVGETFNAPALKGVPEGATIDVTYSSNNTDVAIVTDNVVSLVKGATGTATITATFAGNDEYNKASATYTITVEPKPSVMAKPTSLDFEAVIGQDPVTETFTVMAENLKGDITLTMSESDVFTIEPASIAKADMTDDGVEVTVTYTPTQAGNDNATITIASEAAESATVTLNGTTTVPEVVAMPTFSLVAGSYTGVQQLTISCATEGATISYSTDGGQTWTEGNTVNVDKDMTIMAKASKNGYTISETATAAYIIDIPEELPTITPFKGYYQIKNNGNGMYANIAGRKTLNFTDAPADKAGTVIWLETNDKGQVQSIRSQAADLQGYANRAMRYVPEIVELVADKLNADGEGNLLGETGLKKIMEKFNESFDHHLYVEQAGEGWRLYGKTPSMQPVVDFYRENTAQVEAKLPMLESFINSALNKLKEKIGGQSVFTDFSLLDIWEKMGGTLTKPVDEASIMAFYREVLNNKNYVWDFAYQTAMIYVNNLTSHDRWSEVEEYLGEYAQYIDKIDQIRPDFKYYVVADGNKPDFISEGNKDIINDAARTIWTLEDRTTFTVNIPANAETTCDKFQKATTLYTDFAYTVPNGVTAYKVTDVVEGTAITEALSGVIPAQTPVLLMAAEAGDKVLTLSTEAGTAVTSNLLVGPDYLINTYKLTTPQVEGIFNMIKEKLGEDFYNTYVKEYEHLMYLNSGTVNNKYFWGLKEEDVKKCTYLDEEGVKDYVVRGLEGNAFVNNKQVKTNKAFLVSEDAQIISLNKRGDVNHDGKVNIKDVTDLIDRLLDPENTAACPICSDFNLSGKVDIKDVTDLIDVLLTAPYAEQENPSTGSQD